MQAQQRIRFSGFVLRTIDVASARAFYAGLLREDLPAVVELSAPARARVRDRCGSV